jgi:hypothetical protein
MWDCPDCGPQVGQTKQSHEKAPATTPEEYFSTGPPRVRPLYQPGRHQNVTSTRRLVRLAPAALAARYGARFGAHSLSA